MSTAPFTAPTPVRVVIVDDEPLARQHIENLLDDQENVFVVGVAESGDAAIEAIRTLNPDIVFLDMQMPGSSGLEVVRQVGPGLMPVTVFVTAHDQYAVQAFELAAADYLLKPFSDERFDEAFRRARERVETEDLSALREQLRLVLETGGSELSAPRYLKRIAVQGRNRLRVVLVSEIDYIVANGVYVEIHVGRGSHLVRTSLNTLEEHLDPAQFFRIHRSAIVSLDHVELLIREGGGSCQVQLESGKKLPVGRSKRAELERRLGKL